MHTTNFAGAVHLAQDIAILLGLGPGRLDDLLGLAIGAVVAEAG